MAIYFVVPALSAIAPLVAIPSVASEFGSNGWAAVAVGLSVGNTAAILCDLGWGVIGPQMVARASPSERSELLDWATSSKVAAVLIASLPAAALSAALSPAYPIAAAITAVGVTAGSLSLSWYFVGENRPTVILMRETVPRVTLILFAAFALTSGAPLEVYGLALFCASAGAYVLSARAAGQRIRPRSALLASLRRAVRTQRVLMGGRAVSTFYTSLPAALLATVNPQAVAVFSAVDRPLRMGLAILGGVPARFQSWLGRPAGQEGRQKRAVVSILVNLGVGVLAGVVFFLFMPTVAQVLFAGTVDVSYTLSAIGGVLAAVICFSRGLGLVLVMMDHHHGLTSATVASAATAAILLLALGASAGAGGALVALVVAESVGVAVQVALLAVAIFRRRP